MRRQIIKAELAIFGRCYCAVPEGEYARTRDDLADLKKLSFAVPTHTWATRKAARRERRSGQPWTVTKWVKR